jgi:hypothetical protein
MVLRLEKVFRPIYIHVIILVSKAAIQIICSFIEIDRKQAAKAGCRNLGT